MDRPHDFDQAEREALDDDASDQALEAACAMRLAVPTLVNTYCFTCPAGQMIPSRAALGTGLGLSGDA